MARLCPHCDTYSNFDTHYRGSIGYWGKPGEQSGAIIEVATCQVCRGIIVIYSRHTPGNALKEFLVIPSSVPSVSEFVNAKVAADYVSAVNCLSISEYKPAATMFRRSLQQIMIDKGANGDKLYKQIDDLAKSGVITEEIREWAHEIRFLGNDGAHPSQDYLDEVTEDEIGDAKLFLERLFDYVYIMPGKTAAARKRREDKKDNTDS